MSTFEPNPMISKLTSGKLDVKPSAKAPPRKAPAARTATHGKAAGNALFGKR